MVPPMCRLPTDCSGNLRVLVQSGCVMPWCFSRTLPRYQPQHACAVLTRQHRTVLEPHHILMPPHKTLDNQTEHTEHTHTHCSYPTTGMLTFSQRYVPDPKVNGQPDLQHLKHPHVHVLALLHHQCLQHLQAGLRTQHRDKREEPIIAAVRANSCDILQLLQLPNSVRLYGLCTTWCSVLVYCQQWP